MTDKTEAPKDSPETTPKTTGAPADAEAAKKGGKAVWASAAVGVGSAALVAALMYASRRNKKA